MQLTSETCFSNLPWRERGTADGRTQPLSRVPEPHSRGLTATAGTPGSTGTSSGLHSGEPATAAPQWRAEPHLSLKGRRPRAC